MMVSQDSPSIKLETNPHILSWFIAAVDIRKHNNGLLVIENSGYSNYIKLSCLAHSISQINGERYKQANV